MSTWCDRIVTGGLLLLIVFTPFAFGSVHPLAYLAMEATIFLLVVVWMIRLVRGQRSDVRGQSEIQNPQSEIVSLALPLALFFGLVLFQLVPLPPSLLRVLSPFTYEYY